MDVFLSYDRDDRARAESVAKALQANGLSVWWDVRIPTGKTFDEVIEHEVSVAACMIVLWSSASVSSRWVKEEADEGLRRNILMPVLIDPVTIPMGFRRIQAAELINWTGDDADERFQKLLADIAHKLPRAATPKAAAAAATQGKPPVVVPVAKPAAKPAARRAAKPLREPVAKPVVAKAKAKPVVDSPEKPARPSPLAETLRGWLEALKGLHPRVFLSPNVPKDREANARKYGAVRPNEQVLCLIDLTVFAGTASDCVVFTEKAIYNRSFSTSVVIPYSDLRGHELRFKDSFFTQEIYIGEVTLTLGGTNDLIPKVIEILRKIQAAQ
ncbi:MAG: toll/interleukin-1 receptor domain-containing protein [Bryobacterales bacterium]|nr:toll/interleukin-1 receptor domain-containing protein [Bryobacterales bacterium]